MYIRIANVKMTRFSLTLAALVAPAVLAIPKVPGYGYGGYGSSSEVIPNPTVLPTGAPFPHPSGIPHSGGSLGPIGTSSAPFGFGNSTGITGPTGTGSVIGTGSPSPSLSTVTVVPVPETSAVETGSEIATSQPIATGNSPVGASSGAEECGPATVTVTSANTVTVTVGSAPVSSAEESSPISVSSAISVPYPIGNTTTAGPTGTVGTVSGLPIESSSDVSVPTDISTPTSIATQAPIAGIPTSVLAHGYHHISLHGHHSKLSVPAYTPILSSEAVPVIPASTPSSSTSPEAVPATPTIVPVYSSPLATSTSAASPTTHPSTSGGNVVPRGLVYNTAALTDLFDKNTIGWCYNWDSQPGGEIPSNFNFVPMLWSTNQYHLPNWESNTKEAISNGATHILGFNEPDLGAQANMSPQEAANAWDNMEKFAGQVKIGSPAVCNGGGDTGLNWLQKFIDACSSCTIDFLAIHWYGDANDFGVQNLKDHIEDAKAMAGGRPIWLTEFQPSGSTEAQADFMSKILPYLDDKSNGVERYAYFEVDGVLTSGGALSQLGSKYVA